MGEARGVKVMSTDHELCYVSLEFENMWAAAYGYTRLDNQPLQLEEMYNTCIFK